MGRPTGVTVIAVLDFIGGAFCLLLGLALMLGGGFIATMMSQQQRAGAGFLGAIGAAAGVFIIVCSALAIVLGLGLMKLKEWARIATIVLCAIGAVFGLLGLFAVLAHFSVVGIFWALCRLAIDILIIWYLLQPHVKAAFQGAQVRAVGA